MKINSIKICLFALLPFTAMAQITIKGVVTDASNKEALPFTAVAIKGTSIGTSTDIDGRFVLRVPEDKKDGKLQVSCVGYKTDLRDLSSIAAGQYATIAMESSISEISEVAVSAKSKFSQTIVRNAISKISNNYITKPYNYEFTYTDEKPQGKSVHKRTATVLYFDQTGYFKGNAYQNFKNCQYKFTAAQRNFLAQTIGECTTNIDDLLLFDVVRNTGNVLDAKRLGDYDIKIEKSIVFNGDSIWVLTFNNNRPNLVTTGDWNATSSHGTLMIKKDDFAVLKYTVEVSTSIKNELAQALAVDTAAQTTSFRKVSYRAETTYEKQDGVYVLKQINYSSTGDNRVSRLEVTEVKTENVDAVQGREYLEQANMVIK